ncbi:ATP-binding cassette sub-family C member 8-like [Glandiceps talaboti]
MMASVTPPSWFCASTNSSDGLAEQCFVDLLVTCTQTLFLVLFSVVLTVLGCCTNLRHFKLRALIPFPGHNCKWIFTGLLCLTLLCAVGEGILTDLTRNDVTQPRLYVPQVVALLTGLVTLVYYHHMEYWNRPGLAWLLLSYWVISLVGEGVKMKYLLSQLDFDIRILRFDVIITSALFYTCCLIVEVNLLRTKVCNFCYYQNKYPRDLKKKNMHFYDKYCNLLSRLSFWWMTRLFRLGYKRPLEMPDVGCLTEEQETKFQYEVFEEVYKKEQERASSKNEKPSLWRIYVKAYGKEMALTIFIKAIGDTLAYIPPVAIGGIVSYATVMYYDEEQEYVHVKTSYVTLDEFFSNGFVLIGVSVIATLLRGLFMHYGGWGCTLYGIHLRTAVQAKIYEKSLHLSSLTLSSGELTIGKITNHMAVDAMALQMFFEILGFLVVVPYQIIVTLVLLYLELGISAIIGFLVLVVLTPVQYFLCRAMSTAQEQVLEISDQRLKKSNELLQGMKLLKLYGWEEIFSYAIEVIREKEVKEMLKVAFQIIAITISSQVTPGIVCFVSFSIYSVLSPTPLTPELAFATLALVFQISVPLVILPFSLRFLINALASTKRLRAFFNASEIQEYENGRSSLTRGFIDCGDNDDDEDEDMEDIEDFRDLKPRNGMYHRIASDDEDVAIKGLYQNDQDKYAQSGISDTDHPHYGTFDTETSLSKSIKQEIPEHIALQIVNGCFAWENDGAAPTLKNINLQVPLGSLYMVIGTVGSGKSSLLSAILGEISKISGSVQFNRGKNRVSYISQKAWIQNVTLKDNILFGQPFNQERYKSVLHACSLQPDLDILPAGDMTEIGERGINLSGGQKQRVSIARAIYSDTDIVLMDDPLSALDVHVGAHVMEHGIMDLLLREDRTVILVTHQMQNLHYANQVILMEDGQVARQDNLNELKIHNPELFAEWTKIIDSVSESETEGATEELEDISDAESDRESLRRQVSRDEVERINKKESDGTLIAKEEREIGSVSWRIYLAYAKAVKYPFAALTVLLFVGVILAQMATDFWMAAWSETGVNSNKTQNELAEETTYYLSVYGGLLSSFVILSVLSFSSLIIFTLLAAKRIHIKLLRNIVHAPLRFFDTNPIGRILNRFSSDTNIIDQKLPATINSIFVNVTLFCAAFIINTVAAPVFALLMVPVLVPYYFVFKFYVVTSRELQRLDNISRSPVFSQFSESLGGLQTIRAFRDEKRFKRYLINRIDANNTAHFYVHLSYRWLSVLMEIFGSCFILVSGLSSLVSCVLGDLEPSLVGLGLTYSLTLVGRLNWTIRMLAECEMQMNSIERVEYYTNVQTEEYQGIVRPPQGWPDKGNIQVKNISVRYSKDSPTVLHGINVNFKASKKIGICGRTGSGKSSLTLALFRLVDTYEGCIEIDGIDIKHVPLLTLRQRLAIIPQDPVLFSGTIRFNLDPECRRSDDELWEALEIAQLKDVVNELDKRLDSDVSEDGENFSVGQRQLFCLARAFLRKARVLVMDEATASIDMKTDAILQNVVATAFADRTVLTIAHRIATIVDSDSVLVLSDGKVIEYGSPKTLYNSSGSAFASLVKGK